MGNECCQQQNVGIYEIDVSSKLRKEEFAPVEIPKDDSFLMQKIKQYSELDTPTVMKHLNMDKYYWGQWQQGAPVGDGFLYVPDSYFYKGKFSIKPNGYGEIELLKSGLKYKGDISQGRAEGRGTLSHSENLYSYDGLWKNSEPVTGTLIIKPTLQSSAKTIVQFNDFPMKDTKITYPDGREYIGTVHSKNFTPQGRGRVTYVDGSSYDGEWSQGQFHGDGVYTWRDGSSYDGSYQYGLKHGFGKYVYPSKKIYQGQWIKGFQHGRASLFNQRGDLIKKGIWNQGKFLTSDEI